MDSIVGLAHWQCNSNRLREEEHTVSKCSKLKPGLFYMYISLLTSSFCNVLLEEERRKLIVKKNPILQDIAARAGQRSQRDDIYISQ